MKQKLCPFATLIGILCIITIANSCKHLIPIVPNGGTGGNNGGTNGGNTGGSGSSSCDTNTVYFQQQALPILVSNCAQSGCHNNTSAAEGIVLTSYNNVMQTGGVTPGNAAGSKLYQVIQDGSMPPNGYANLTSAQQTLIYNWIQQGAKDLVCTSLCDSGVYTYSKAIQPIIANQCQGCHNSTNAGGGIDLSTYSAVKAQADNGKLWGAVNGSSGFILMPLNGSKLSSCQLAQIQKWIAAGSLNN